MPVMSDRSVAVDTSRFRESYRVKKAAAVTVNFLIHYLNCL